MTEAVTLAELLRVIVVTGGLLISAWALVDDYWDLAAVRRFGEVGGPRWVLASEHAWFNCMLLIGWLSALGTLSITIWLPARPDAAEDMLAQAASWLSLVFGVCVLTSQVVRRAGRVALRALPLAAWERMLGSLASGTSPADRATLSARLLAATAAGREIAHAAANEIQPAMDLLSLVAEDTRVPADYRLDAATAAAELERAITRIKALHLEIRALEDTT